MGRTEARSVVVLGGAGAMGRVTVRDLVETLPRDESWRIQVADWSLDRAKALVASFDDPRLQAVRVDVKDRKPAIKALGPAFALINSTSHHLNLDAMELALDLGAHYVDLGGLFHVTRKQLGLDGRFKKAGRLALLGMGAAPGVTNILARKAADRLDTVQEIHTRVASVDKTEYATRTPLDAGYSLQTILEEFSLEPAVFTNGEFTFVPPMSGLRAHRFPDPVGLQRPMHTLHSEVATLPLSFANKGIRECTFKIAFDPEFIDRICFLRDLGLASAEKIDFPDGSRVAPIELVNRVVMSHPAPVPKGRRIQHEVVRAIVKGTRKGKKVTLVEDLHVTGMPAWGIGLEVDTGSPPAVAVQMLGAGEINATGVCPPEACVPVKPFFDRLRLRKMRVTSAEVAGWTFKA
ncbi:MAG: saccharopine dehydrogenase NADP-binding domain-containing protein [Candidatus Sericytochromatia bacterium]|nr:saccharopine dehydrogenase NADP-binding domain-containing protein [Candidatus Tanganyikabacteria bacterium]